VKNVLGISGEFAGGEINYYYQGFVAAARNDNIFGRAQMNVLIEGWNLGEYFVGNELNWGQDRFNSMHIRQIEVAKRWAGAGFNFYEKNQ
jgi:hypothetical protein